ncbi:FTR1 family protein [Microbulbifer bruguierae]|uniref:FTR1 family protein n=1 Tax=Microbulbifer bruguierae TaxID=3029061 RepID=A0ABY8NHK9_9GAMM|nr:FTR1 family protein [Microbulbifer bruguierae]WGL18420.1 FTR1 family protein [Microbulbifer bruguierae]
MLLTSVILVLREVLEAALLLSILLAMTHYLGLKSRWIFIALTGGILGSIAYGAAIGAVSETFDGMGQELLNAAMQFAIYGLLLLIGILLINNRGGRQQYRALLQWCMVFAVALATLREGSEVFVYMIAFRHQSDLLQSVLSGALIGAGIGFSIGALFYYLLVGLPQRRRLLVALVLLTLVAAGLCLQATQLLEQADWLPAQTPLWDTSALLSENSLMGQLCYALLGYEATPTPIAVAAYVLGLLLMAFLLSATWFRRGLPERESSNEFA